MKTLYDRVTLPTRVIVHRAELTASELAAIVQKGEYAPAEGATCEVEAGGQILARGRMVRRRGEWFFKVLATAETEEKK
jgi:hypothetical protein